MAYAFDDGPAKLWLPGEPIPPEIADHIAADGVLVAHNAAFERVIWKYVMTPRYGWPEPRVGQWRCTMVMAYAMALPGALADVAPALGLEDKKDAAGHRLMLSMAKPRKVIGKLPARDVPPGTFWDDGWQTFTGTDGAPLRIQWWVAEDRKQRLYDYCRQDVAVERAVEKRLLQLRPSEQRMWELDQIINDRGVYVDEKACLAAKDVVAAARKQYNAAIKLASNFAVGAVTNVAEITAFVEAEGTKVPGLAKDDVATLLARDDLTPAARRVLELRRDGSRMATQKISALLNCRSRDGRARGLLQFHAASTGRWGGRRFQPQNLKRPDSDQAEIDSAIDLLRAGATEAFLALYDDPMAMIGDCVRGMVCAPSDRQMAAADFANIEGRLLAWLAGEAWKLDAFRAYDAGTGPDLYKLSFARSFGKPVDEVSKDDRQIGKVQELALGYQGGPGAFQAMARGYGVNIGEQYNQILEVSARDIVDEAVEAWDSYGKRSGMSETNWLAAEMVKRAWRSAHPATVNLWSSIEEAALAAVRDPGAIVTCGRLMFRVSGSFLFMRLPSGRALCYPYPKIRTKRTPWGSDKEQVHFFGQDTLTRKWGETSTYGGKLTENAVQAIASDILRAAIESTERAGIETVLHVHDEQVFELAGGQMIEATGAATGCLQNEGIVNAICALMTAPPEWLDGCPVAADGWIGERYRK